MLASGQTVKGGPIVWPDAFRALEGLTSCLLANHTALGIGRRVVLRLDLRKASLLPQPPMHRFASFDGTNIAFHDAGAGPAVVLLHGAFVDAASHYMNFAAYADRLHELGPEISALTSRPDWQRLFDEFEREQAPPFRVADLMSAIASAPRPVVSGVGLFDFFVEHGFRVLAPDARGHGASDAPTKPEAYAERAMARDVLALLDHCNVEHAYVYGCSMGGVTVAHLLTIADPRVKAAVLGGIGDWIVEGQIFHNPLVPRGTTAAEAFEDFAKQITDYPQAQRLPFPFGAYPARYAKDREAAAAVLRGHIMHSVAPQELQLIRIPVLHATGVDEPEGDHIDGFRMNIPQLQVARAGRGHVEPAFQEDFQHMLLHFFRRVSPGQE
jgi:pimeloyl-ACP methyl ester carboxylesterase